MKNRALEMVLAGIGGLLLLLIYFGSRARANRRRVSVARKLEPLPGLSIPARLETAAFELVPDGQERLATQAERDDVNETIARVQVMS